MSDTTIRTLMCRDHEVSSFAYDPIARRVVGRPRIIERAYLPLGCLGHDGTFTSPRLAAWLSNRSIPATRPGVSSILQRLNLQTPEELMAAGLGLSLSDQYWLRPEGFTKSWNDVNYFEHPFSPALGEALAPHDPDSGSQALSALEDGILATSTPDSSLNGNLPKRWQVIEGTPQLAKTGKAENLFQEPLNEAIATRLCERILQPGDFVPYELVENGYPHFISRCPCMVDARTELVPAADVIRSRPMPNDRSRYEIFARACEEHGVNGAREALDKMLVIDHIVANFDRHWGNFGILMDSETRTWLRVAPIFDTGEALWCDRPFANDFSPYRLAHPMSFIRAIGDQLKRYVHRAPWLDPAALDGFAEEAVALLARSRVIADIPGRLAGIQAALERNLADVARLA